MSNYTPYRGRTTIYRGIRMRSRLEAAYAEYLDRSGSDWEYEPNAYASVKGQYLPDFVVGGTRFIEVKPTGKVDQDEIFERMHIVLDSEPQATLEIAHSSSYPHVWSHIKCPCEDCEARRFDIELILPKPKPRLYSQVYEFLASKGGSYRSSIICDVPGRSADIYEAIDYLRDVGYIREAARESGQRFYWIEPDEVPF